MSAARTRPCRICGAAIAPFMSFGRMPIANGFLAEADIPSEFFYELAPAFCEACSTCQLIDQPSPGQMFHERYPFFTASSPRMAAHFSAFASAIAGRVTAMTPDPLVVEIGSNDGTMLQAFNAAGVRCVGVEPSRNVADTARARGLEIIDAFFDPPAAARIRADYGEAAAIVAANVICHIPDFHALAQAVCDVLAPDGCFVFEDPYLGAMLDQHAYDQIYDEHVFIWSATSVSNAVARHGLDLIDVEPQTTHGGSMRYYCARAGHYPVSRSVGALLDRERASGLTARTAFDHFRIACESSRRDLRALLESLRAQGKRVAGYAATSKSTTVLNYCGIDRSLIPFIVDTTPIKQGTVTPGAHIPVRPPAVFITERPDYAVLFAWNHATEILAKEKAFTAAGGKWIRFVPDVAILD